MQEVPRFGVHEFVGVVNQTLEYSFPMVEVVGEVAEFRVSQGKWVSFKIKDAEVGVECFLARENLRVALEDGMKIVVRAAPRLTKWGRFSLNVRGIVLVGEGDIRKNFEKLREKLAREGLFARKRRLPAEISRIAVVSSVEAAGYKDFIKILNERWGGLFVEVAHTQVQGAEAADQMIRALTYFNERSEAQVIVFVRGGGAREDLAAFDDERLVRAIAASKIPVVTGVGHEIDVTLADLAADVRASTPSNAAQILSRDKGEVARSLRAEVEGLRRIMVERVVGVGREVRGLVEGAGRECVARIEGLRAEVGGMEKVLRGMNPEEVLRRGYGIIRGDMKVGSVVKITTFKEEVRAEVKYVAKR
jgi:exodeoxyribonuclease VII large subunit